MNLRVVLFVPPVWQTGSEQAKGRRSVPGETLIEFWIDGGRRRAPPAAGTTPGRVPPVVVLEAALPEDCVVPDILLNRCVTLEI